MHKLIHEIVTEKLAVISKENSNRQIPEEIKLMLDKYVIDQDYAK